MHINRLNVTIAGILAGICLAVAGSGATSLAAQRRLEVLTSTFPVFLITRSVAAGREGVKVESMLPAQMGCPHDYVLTPQDMNKLARADIFVINGLGLEEFMGTPVAQANAGLTIIDSSAGISDLLPSAHSPGDRHETERHETGFGRHAGNVNPHIFASPRLAARMAGTIATGLAAADPSGAALYQENARAFGAEMNRLAAEMAALGRRLAETRIVTEHGIFDYLARDMGLTVAAVVQEHEGQEPSAAQMLALVQEIRARKAAALFTEPQYPSAVGQTIAREAGIPSATLDPVASGPENAPQDYYAMTMRRNMQVLEKTLGTRP